MGTAGDFMKLTTNNLSILSLILISTIVLISSATYSADYSAESTVAPHRSIAADILRRAVLENDLLLLQSLVRDFNAGRTDPFFCFRGSMAPFGQAILDATGRPLSDPLDYAIVHAPKLAPTLRAARIIADEYARDAVLKSRTRRANPQEPC